MRTEQLGDNWTYIIATPMESLAELDNVAEPDLERSRLLERIRNCIVNRQSYAVRPIADASNPIALGTPPKLE